MRCLSKLITTQNFKSGGVESIVTDIIRNHLDDKIYILQVDNKTQFKYLFINEVAIKEDNLTKNYENKTLEQVYPIREAKNLAKFYRRAIFNKRAYTYIEKCGIDNQVNKYYETTITPIQNKEGAIVYLIVKANDVTSFYEQTNKLTRQKQSYQSLIEHNMDGILQIDQNGNIIGGNYAIQTITGYKIKQIINQSIFNLIPDNEKSKYEHLIEQTKKGESLESYDCRMIHRNGNSILLKLKIIPIVIDLEVSGFYFMFRDISTEAEQAETVKYLAFHDQLTGLLNRRALLKDLKSILTRAEETSSEVAVLSIDVDRFKHLNDKFGHLVADELIKMIGARLEELVPLNGYVYRQSGDEFIIVLENEPKTKVSKFATHLLDQFAQVFHYGGNEYFLSLSIGISMYPDDGLTEERLLLRADEALFQVKRQGRAHYQFYDKSMGGGNENIVEMGALLHQAIDRDELSIFLQPQVHLRTKEINSYEALLRWNNPTLGNVSPGEFIPLAEDLGLIIPIGNWVIYKTCHYIKYWNELGLKDIRIAINISPRQFGMNLIKTLKAALQKYEISPTSLEIEITEGVLGNVDEAIPILEEIRKLGITISIDDFGTGYSSLNYLKSFPIDVLKIDRTFIKDVTTDLKDAAIATTIIHLGKSLGLEVIAEGVETIEQANFLRENHCHKAQGFYFSKPFPAEKITKLLN